MSKTKEKAEVKVESPQIQPVDGEHFNEQLVKLYEQIEAKYSQTPATTLLADRATAWEKLKNIEKALGEADDSLTEAAKKDEKIFATAGEALSTEATNYEAERQRVAQLFPKLWATSKRWHELDIACNLKRAAELEAEGNELYPRVRQAEEEAKKAQRLAEDMWSNYHDINSERDVLQRDAKKRARVMVQLLEGPDLHGARKLLFGG